MTSQSATVQKNLVLGVDLGGTKTSIGLIDEQYRVIRRSAVRSSEFIHGNISILISNLRKAIRAAEKNSTPVTAIGLGIAGVPDSAGEDITQAPNLAMLPGSKIGRFLSEELNLPVILENDVNLTALGEQSRGAGRLVSSFALLAIGTGLGAAFIDDGRLIRGETGSAGEIGQVLSHKQDSEKTRFLAFEEVLSGPQLAERAEEVLGRPTSPSDLIALADGGLPEALSIINEYVATLSELVRIMDSIADPGMLILGGGLGSNLGITNRLRSVLRSENFATPVQQATLGHDAALIGARVLCEIRNLQEVTAG